MKKLGITTIVDLRAEFPRTAKEERIGAESLGMRFLQIPLGGFSTPNNSDFAHFFQILKDPPSETIFLHCEFGRDRTGVMIAAYRIAFENWSSDQALSEMMAFGLNRTWHPSTVTYVHNLRMWRESDAELRKAVRRD